ncbi:MAG: phosphomannomutase/phosphoglucomutase, partial [Bdellovibrionota bacterium]
MKYQPVIFREYDVRGVFEKEYNLKFAQNLARAFVSAVYKKTGKKNPTIAVGFDARISSPSIADHVCAGLNESGADSIRLGLVTSPVAYYSTFALEQVDGAIMITGSHNPPEYNGFKLSIGKSTIFGEAIKQLETIILDKDYLTGAGKDSSFDIFPSYLERYKKEFGDLKNVPVVLDCGNGAGGIIARRLYEAVGLKPTILFEQPDGTFPNHHPDPTVEENLHDLKAEVLKRKAAVGIGFDGDADRIGVVDDTGRMVYGDELIALYARFILADKPGQKIIGDVKCSDRLYHYIAKHGGVPIMWKTGHSLIKEKIKVEKAPFGGELSGHIFFADRNYGYDDALYAGLRVIEIIAKTGKKLSEILSDFPPAFNTPEIRIDTTEEKKVAIVETLKKAYATPKPMPKPLPRHS